MKLGTILANNGEPLGDAAPGSAFIHKIDACLQNAIKECSTVLMYATELDADDVEMLQKELSGWTFSLQSTKGNNKDFKIACTNDPHTEFYNYQPNIKGQYSDEGGLIAVSTNKEKSYVGSLLHLSPHAGGKKNFYGYLVNGNSGRQKIVDAVIDSVNQYCNNLLQEGHTAKKFHLGYYEMFGSIFWHLLLRRGKQGCIPQHVFIQMMKSLGRTPIGEQTVYTYETLKFKYPIRFQGVHGFVDTSMKKTSQIIYPPTKGNDRATIFSTLEW